MRTRPGANANPEPSSPALHDGACPRIFTVCAAAWTTASLRRIAESGAPMVLIGSGPSPAKTVGKPVSSYIDSICPRDGVRLERHQRVEGTDDLRLADVAGQ